MHSITGFTKTSSLVYFSLSAVVFASFCIFELKNLHWETESCKTGRDNVPGVVYAGKGLVWHSPRGPGEGYLYKRLFLRVCQQIHLWSVIPAGILLPLQFLPIMRRKHMTLHRWSGRLLFLFLMIGNVTGLNLSMNAFGGMLDTRLFAMMIAISTTFSTWKSWRGIRALRLDVHRAWVIRTWAYAGSILSLRLWMGILITGLEMFTPGQFHIPISCAKLEFMFPSDLSNIHTRYPICANLASSISEKTFVAVMAEMNKSHKEKTAAMLSLSFGVAGLVGLVMNIMLVEAYLNLTRDEDERLKKVSASRRRAMGWGKADTAAFKGGEKLNRVE